MMPLEDFYKYLSINILNLNFNALEDMDNEHWSELIDTIKLILKMSKDCGKIISLDQCEFINKDNLN